MNRLLAFGFLILSLVLLSQASLLVIEEGTPEGTDWRQLTVELPPAFVDASGNIFFDVPVWMRREVNDTFVFAVLGSLICPDASEQAVAALIDGAWECLDINDPSLPPASRKRNVRASDGRVDPPICAPGMNMAPAIWTLATGWTCADPVLGLIQSVHTDPNRPTCHDTDLVVYDEGNGTEGFGPWFICKPLDSIQFESTISKTDLRWQVPSTVRHIGSIAASGQVRSGQYNNFRWSTYVFAASTETIAYDQTSPPQVVTTGGVNWVAYTLSTTYVAISGINPYVKTVFYPIYPGTTSQYNSILTHAQPGVVPKGNALTFSPGILSFSPSGSNMVSYIGTGFKYNSAAAGPNAGYVIVPLVNATVTAGNYPIVEIAPTQSDWYVGTTADYNPYLILTIAMWLQYEAPSGF